MPTGRNTGDVEVPAPMKVNEIVAPQLSLSETRSPFLRLSKFGPAGPQSLHSQAEDH